MHVGQVQEKSQQDRKFELSSRCLLEYISKFEFSMSHNFFDIHDHDVSCTSIIIVMHFTKRNHEYCMFIAL